MMHKGRSLFSRSELKARGWTRTLIGKFLPLPDDYRPLFPSRSPMALWLRSRVESIEATGEWKAACERGHTKTERSRRTS